MATPTISRSRSPRSTRSADFDWLLALYAAAEEQHRAGLRAIVRASGALGARYGEQHQLEALDLLRLPLHREIDRVLDAELARLSRPRARGHLRLALNREGT